MLRKLIIFLFLFLVSCNNSKNSKQLENLLFFAFLRSPSGGVGNLPEKYSAHGLEAAGNTNSNSKIMNLNLQVSGSEYFSPDDTTEFSTPNLLPLFRGEHYFDAITNDFELAKVLMKIRSYDPVIPAAKEMEGTCRTGTTVVWNSEMSEAFSKASSLLNDSSNQTNSSIQPTIGQIISLSAHKYNKIDEGELKNQLTVFHSNETCDPNDQNIFLLKWSEDKKYFRYSAEDAEKHLDVINNESEKFTSVFSIRKKSSTNAGFVGLKGVRVEKKNDAGEEKNTLLIHATRSGLSQYVAYFDGPPGVTVLPFEASNLQVLSEKTGGYGVGRFYNTEVGCIKGVISKDAPVCLEELFIGEKNKKLGVRSHLFGGDGAFQWNTRQRETANGPINFREFAGPPNSLSSPAGGEFPAEYSYKKRFRDKFSFQSKYNVTTVPANPTYDFKRNFYFFSEKNTSPSFSAVGVIAAYDHHPASIKADEYGCNFKGYTETLGCPMQGDTLKIDYNYLGVSNGGEFDIWAYNPHTESYTKTGWMIRVAKKN